MTPSKQVKRLQDFLEKKTNLYTNIFHRIAETQYEEINKHMENPPSLDDYILIHKKEISEQSQEILHRTCEEIISKSDYSFLFTQIGIFSLFLLPPLYPLVRYAIRLINEKPFDLVEFSLCACSICLLLVLLSAAAYAVFKVTFTKKRD